LSIPEKAVTEICEEKRRVLNRALRSATFARSEKLRHFLTYLCEMEMAGRGAELNEYSIGVDALGRGSGFSPAEDSIVRSTAYVLRQKLHELYTKELPDESLRLDLPKGHYVPQYAAGSVQAAEPEDLSEATPAQLQIVPPRVARFGRRMAVVFLGGLLLGAALVGVVVWRISAALPGDPVVRRAWGPLIGPGVNVMLGVSNSPQLTVHRMQDGVQPPHYIPLPPQLALPAEVWRLRREYWNSKLSLEWNDTYLGDSRAAIRAALTLTSLGAPIQIVPTKDLSIAAFHWQNLILIGSPEYSGTAARILARTPLDIQMDPVSGSFALFERDSPGAPARRYMPRDAAAHTESFEYGVVTVAPSEGSSDVTHRTLLFSGTSPAAAHGAVEYFSSRKALDQLEAAFRRAGQKGFPAAFQVVVRCVEVNGLMFSYQYETHRLMDPRLALR
jgi:hypothetical protein